MKIIEFKRLSSSVYIAVNNKALNNRGPCFTLNTQIYDGIIAVAIPILFHTLMVMMAKITCAR